MVFKNLFERIFPKKSTFLSNEEFKLLAGNIRFDAEIGNFIWEVAKGQVNQLNGFSEHGDQVKANGFSLLVKGDSSEDLFLTLTEGLLNKGYLHFYTEDMDEPHQIAVIKGTDKYDILKTMQTNAGNYDMDNKGIIKKLKFWEQQNPIKIIGAGFDWVNISFSKLPCDMKRFVKDIYEFCPDTVDQGVGSLKELEREIRESKSLFLWWD